MYYLIKEKLTEATLEECLNRSNKYVAILTPEEWVMQNGKFEMGIDLNVEAENDTTKAEVNFDSLTGSFSIPDRKNICGDRREFAFALDERGVVFIDKSNGAADIVAGIANGKVWRFPSLERFLYDFLENILGPDRKMLEQYEMRLERLENNILADKMEDVIENLNDIRGDLVDLKTHYEQMLDVAQELEENENCFFEENNLRYFRLIINRLERYRDQILALREYSMQIRDLYQSEIDIKQNKTMAALTVITTIFFPLSIITGWYGMNFTHMPELDEPLAYPILGGVCFLIIVFSILFYKKKKWL